MQPHDVRLAPAALLSDRALQLLAENPQGLTLPDIARALGRPGRPASRATVVMLRRLVKLDPPRVHRGHAAGVRMGTYTITPAGRAWLLGCETLGVQEAEPVLPTGAMRFEVRTVVRRAALPGQAPKGLISSVFALGHGLSEDPLALHVVSPPRGEAA